MTFSFVMVMILSAICIVLLFIVVAQDERIRELEARWSAVSRRDEWRIRW